MATDQVAHTTTVPGTDDQHFGTATTMENIPRGVHMVGSIPHQACDNVEEVWSKLFTALPGRLDRVPDGELGDRFYYVNWQASIFPAAVLRANATESTSGEAHASYTPQLDDIKPLGYDVAAIESYRHFVKQREAGAIPKGVRFQVSLPSPLEAIGVHVHPPYQAAVAPLYEQRMLEALQNIQVVIPHEDLAIQWDVAVSLGFIETERGNLDNPYFKPWFSNALETTMDVLKKVSLATEPNVEMGYHLCYGDIGHQHFCQPKDTSLLVEVANQMIKDVHPVHSIRYIHLPVPKDRTDAAYFAPLEQMTLPEKTQLFLGVVHFDDISGTEERVKAAKQHVTRSFGVATECGMGRTPKDQFDNILNVAATVSSPYVADSTSK